MSVQVTVETNSNEHALKFSVNQQIIRPSWKNLNPSK
jgi:hypothetical protein